MPILQNVKIIALSTQASVSSIAGKSLPIGLASARGPLQACEGALLNLAALIESLPGGLKRPSSRKVQWPESLTRETYDNSILSCRFTLRTVLGPAVSYAGPFKPQPGLPPVLKG